MRISFLSVMADKCLVNARRDGRGERCNEHGEAHAKQRLGTNTASIKDRAPNVGDRGTCRSRDEHGPRANLIRQPAEDIRQEPHAEREGRECSPALVDDRARRSTRSKR
jgi:hypothetical protein